MMGATGTHHHMNKNKQGHEAEELNHRVTEDTEVSATATKEPALCSLCLCGEVPVLAIVILEFCAFIGYTSDARFPHED